MKSAARLMRLAPLAALLCGLTVQSANAAPCVVPDAFGTAGLPPVGCDYVSPFDDMRIVDGLPAGTTVEIDGVMGGFFNIVAGPGGALGGDAETYNAILMMPMVGTGTLLGFNRNIAMPLQNQSHSAPRVPGNPVQPFPTDMFQLQGQIIGDPDFDLLRITGGTGFGMPGPGHTTLTRLGPPGSSWNVDSFFDINYRIDFIGAPGGPLAGRSGSTTATIRMQAGNPIPEPSAAVLLAMGGALLAIVRARRA